MKLESNYGKTITNVVQIKMANLSRKVLKTTHSQMETWDKFAAQSMHKSKM